MSDTNPYRTPTTESRDHRLNPPIRVRLWVFIWPTLVGALLGSFIPFWNGGGTPGNSIGAGVGGFTGLFAGILLHLRQAGVLVSPLVESRISDSDSQG